MRKVVLTIAGSDPAGGAGVQQDIRVLTCIGVYACAAITAITVQNTMGVKSVHPVAGGLLEEQVRAVLEDIDISGIKIGMIATGENIAALSRVMSLNERAWVVADPVMRSKNNKVLMEDSASMLYQSMLLPYVDILTPNIPEASVLSSIQIDSLDTMEKAARVIYEKMNMKRHSIHAPGVYLKGGHMEFEGESVDMFYSKGKTLLLKAKRISNRHTHGTGCVLSSALCGFLAFGECPEDAAWHAKDFVTSAIEAGFRLGRGIGPVDPLIFLK